MRIPRYYKIQSLMKHISTILFKRDSLYKPANEREIGEVSAVESPYCQMSIAALGFMVPTNWHVTLTSSSSKAFDWEVKKGQDWTWLANLGLANLALPLRVNRVTMMSVARSMYWLYSLWQMVEIIGFIQQNSEAATSASWKYEISQSRLRGRTFTAS